MKLYASLLLLLCAISACTATTEVATVQPTRQIEADETAVLSTTTLPDPTKPVAPSTATNMPATETAVPTPQPTNTPIPTPTTEPLPPPPMMPQADAISFGSAGHFAFIQNDNLYIQDLARANPPLLVDSCAQKSYCSNDYFKWSPDGQYLLYHNTTRGEIRLATLTGEWQTIGTDTYRSNPATWSPDGTQILYLRDTETTQLTPVDIVVEEGPMTVDMPLPLLEVMTIPFSAGNIGSAQSNGTLTVDQPGCGGTYPTHSAMLYGNEGGTPLGYSMGVLEWTAQDILLFTTNCTNDVVGRYDLTSGTQLEPLGLMRNLILSPDKSRWFGVRGKFWEEDAVIEFVTGDPTDTAVSVIPTSAQIEMIFMGQQSGDVYITTRHEVTPIGNSYDSLYTSSLWRFDVEAGTETAIYSGEDYAINRVQETADDTILFVQVENFVPHYVAEKTGLSGSKLEAYEPKRHIVALDEAGNLRYLKPDAGYLAVTP